MDDDVDDIYDDPTAANDKTVHEVSRLKRMFEANNTIIKFQPQRPLPGKKPPVAGKPALPDKKKVFPGSIGMPQLPPVADDNTKTNHVGNNGVLRPPLLRTRSGHGERNSRDTIYPPLSPEEGSRPAKIPPPVFPKKNGLVQQNTQVKQPQQGVSGTNSEIFIDQNKVRYTFHPLPEAASIPPLKPNGLRNIDLRRFQDSLAEEEVDEIYDDIENTVMSPSSERPVSLIPDMSEEEELNRKSVMRPPAVPPLIRPPSETYDDVEVLSRKPDGPDGSHLGISSVPARSDSSRAASASGDVYECVDDVIGKL